MLVIKRSAEERKRDFGEVAKGYEKENALKEAERCLQCPDKPCRAGCPVHIDIPVFIKAILEDDIEKAYSTILDSNSLPGICGRVCPQEDQCAKACVLAKKFEPVNIGVLERYVADMALEKNITTLKKSPDYLDNESSIGVVGSGPAGLTLAGDMIRIGYSVTVYEALHESGGVLRYGIPEFRLPNVVIDREIENLINNGVEIRRNCIIGKTLDIEDLLKLHAAVYIGIGSGLPKFMGIKGENLNGVYSANEYLTRSNLMHSYEYPKYCTPLKRGKTVAVIGGGNVAMDAARTALRLGAEKVYNIYRRSREEMPARDEEIENAVAEGVELVPLAKPVEIIGDEYSNTKKIKCIRMRLGEPDESGRKRPIEIPESEFELDVDIVIVAIGTGANRVLLESTENLKLNSKGYIEVDTNYRTSVDKIFAGGDIVTGSATVISAMGAARKAGKVIREMLER
jgi:glutamate synthase (NADPH/NADH) small chain